MGHACFLCLGAYTAGILTKFYGVPYFLALLAGGGVAGAFSLIIGVPTLRGKMSADCFTIATFGFGEATRVVMANINHPYVGGLWAFGAENPYHTAKGHYPGGNRRILCQELHQIPAREACHRCQGSCGCIRADWREYLP